MCKISQPQSERGSQAVLLTVCEHPQSQILLSLLSNLTNPTMVFNNISKIAGDLSALSKPVKKLLEFGLVAVNSHGHKVAYGAAAVALAGAIQTPMAISMGVNAARGVQSLNRISGTLAGIQKQLERMNILQSPKWPINWLTRCPFTHPEEDSGMR